MRTPGRRAGTSGVGVSVAGIAALAGCATPVPAFPEGGTSETTTSASSTSSTGNDPAPGTTGSAEPTGDVEGTSEPLVTTDDGPAPEGARVIFAQGSPVDLGEIDPEASDAIATLELRNEGDDVATRLAADDLVPPLSWAGGAFPGTGGDCAGVLAPGDSCEVVLVAVPGAVGVTMQELEVRYQDGATMETASTIVQALARGTTDDLVTNGGFERGPPGALPPGWTATAGQWPTVNTQAYEGEQSVFAGPMQQSQMVLEQTIDLSPWAETIEAHGMSLRVSAFGRVLNTLFGDDGRVALVELDALGGESVAWQGGLISTTSWAESATTLALSPTTTAVRIELRCLASTSLDCDAWFDEASAFLSYP